MMGPIQISLRKVKKANEHKKMIQSWREKNKSIECDEGTNEKEYFMT